MTRIEARRVARARAQQRYRRGAVVGLLLVAIVFVGAAVARSTGSSPAPLDVAGTAEATPRSAEVTAGAPASAPPPVEISWPETGSRTWRYAPGDGAVLGDKGDVLSFQVAIEEELDLPPEEFAAAVDAILADPNGWTADGKRRFQRVAEDVEADFAIFLGTPGTTEEVCAAEGRHTDRFTSCHLSGQLIINVARWLGGVPDYGAPLAEYQAYAINHEVGHELGFGHEGCPGAGQPAPVMQPQTLGLAGCTAHGWPFLDGDRYRGPKVP